MTGKIILNIPRAEIEEYKRDYDASCDDGYHISDREVIDNYNENFWAGNGFDDYSMGLIEMEINIVD